MIVFNAERIPDKIFVGRQGENEATTHAFDIGEWVEKYGDGTADLLIKRSGESIIYPAAITREENTLFWTITNTETAIPGVHSATLEYRVDEIVKKSRQFTFVVAASLTANTETAPAPYQSYVETVIDTAQSAAQSAAEAAQSAAEAAESQESAAEYAGQVADLLREPLDITDDDGHITISFREV